MNNLLYPKLALSNLKKNKDSFFPFGLSCGVMIAMFYILLSITGQISDRMFYGARAMKSVLDIGVWISGIFSAVVIFYTNNFLIKKRTRELGLYSILGMEKKHIRKVIFWETCLISGGSILCGLASGVLFSKLMFLVLLNILSLKTGFRFGISPGAMVVAAVVFAGIFLAIMFYNQIRLTRLKPIDLLNEAEAGEKEPKANRLLTLVGFLCLGIGYYIAVSVKNPIKAMESFFPAVLLVIIGTYSLFISGSIAILKLLKKQHDYYYQKKHFITVSFMMYRMKQNAAGLASICILSTAVLVVLSSTVSLYLGIENVMRTGYTKDVTIGTSIPYEEDEKETVYDMSLFEKTIEEKCKEYGVEKSDVEEYYYLSLLLKYEKGSFFPVDDQDSLSLDSMCVVEGRVLEDFNRMMNQEYRLKKGQVLVFFHDPQDQEAMDMLEIGSFSANVANKGDAAQVNFGGAYLNNLGVGEIIVVVPDKETLQELSLAYSKFAYPEESGAIDLEYNYNFNLSGNLEQKMEFCRSLLDALDDAGIPCPWEGDIFTARQEILGIYGSLFFVGIFMGTLFLLTTVLIIYYKQISEGYDDRRRFIILQKVGMSKAEVKKVIHSQILSIFFLPILLAVVHVAFAFPILKKILYMMDLTNVTLFIGCTVGTILIFFIVYAIVYGITARVYYKLVNE